MDSSDFLILDAKQAILDEQHRRFEELRQAGNLTDAVHQFQATMSCASDLLHESLRMLERVLDSQSQHPSDPPSHMKLPAV